MHDGRGLEGQVNAKFGPCTICETESLLVQDHNHETGEIRSLICHGCNYQVGLVECGKRKLVNQYALPFMLGYVADWDKN